MDQLIRKTWDNSLQELNRILRKIFVKLFNLEEDLQNLTNTVNALPTTSSAITDGDYGDVVVSGSGTVWTIDSNAVTYAKFQQVADGALLGNASGVDPNDVQEIFPQSSIALSTGKLTLVNDSGAPGNSKYYGTDGGGTLGYYSLPTGSSTWTEVTLNFGSTPVYDAVFTVVDASVVPGSKIIIVPCGKAATGRTADDWQWDGLILAATPGAGVFTVYCTAHPGPIVGNRLVQYQVA